MMNGNQIIEAIDGSSRSSLLPGFVLAAGIEGGRAAPADYARNIVENMFLNHHLDLRCPFTPRVKVMPDIGSQLEELVARTASDREQHRRLMQTAVRYAYEIYCTSGLRNEQVLVRIALELAFDRLYLSQVSDVLHGRWGRYWHLDPRGDRIRRDVGMPDDSLPIVTRNLKLLLNATAKFASAELPEDNIIEPYAGLPSTPAWSCDPLRPPVHALRAAAHVINRVLCEEHFRIMALDLGVNVGAQAVATFCPRAVVHSHSTMLSDVPEQKSPSTFDAVVLAVPSAASTEFVRMVRGLSRPLNRWDVAEYAARPRTDLPQTLRESLSKAIASVRPGGVLAIIGDIGSSSVPIADALVSWTGAFSRVPVGGNLRPVAFRYAERPRDMYGSLPPTGRLVSAWRRNW